MSRAEFVRSVVEKAIPLRLEGLKASEIACKLRVDRKVYRNTVRLLSLQTHCPDLVDAFENSKWGGEKAGRVRAIVEKAIELRKIRKSSKEIADILDITIFCYFDSTATRSIKKYCPDLLDAFLAQSVRKHGLKREDLVFDTIEKLVAGATLQDVFAELETKAPVRAVKILASAMRRAARISGEYSELVSRIEAGEEKHFLAPHEDLTFQKVHHPEKTKKEDRCSKCGDSYKSRFLTVWKGQTFCRKCMCPEDYDILEDIFVRHQNNQMVAMESMLL